MLLSTMRVFARLAITVNFTTGSNEARVYTTFGAKSGWAHFIEAKFIGSPGTQTLAHLTIRCRNPITANRSGAFTTTRADTIIAFDFSLIDCDCL